jgi:hypothetical protein
MFGARRRVTQTQQMSPLASAHLTVVATSIFLEKPSDSTQGGRLGGLIRRHPPYRMAFGLPARTNFTTMTGTWCSATGFLRYRSQQVGPG